MTDSPPRRIDVSAEVPGTPEQVWEAIATGPGITAWFMPAEVEGRVGGTVVHRHDADAASSGTVIAYDPPHRFAYEEDAEGWVPDDGVGPQATAVEFLVEARDGGSCVVRVVMSGFGDGEAWDQAIESFTGGWRQALASLRLYLAHFRGEAASSINVGAMVKAAGGTGPQAWPGFAGTLGLPADVAPGDRVTTTAPGVPALAGTVEEAGDGMLTLLLAEPARGIGLVGVGGPGGDEVYVTVRAQLFGPGAAGTAARERAAWRDWFAATYP